MQSTSDITIQWQGGYWVTPPSSVTLDFKDLSSQNLTTTQDTPVHCGKSSLHAATILYTRLLALANNNIPKYVMNGKIQQYYRNSLTVTWRKGQINSLTSHEKNFQNQQIIFQEFSKTFKAWIYNIQIQVVWNSLMREPARGSVQWARSDAAVKFKHSMLSITNTQAAYTYTVTHTPSIITLN